MEIDVLNMISKPAVINGFMEILLNSVDPSVLSATVFLLSELGIRDNSVIQTLTRVDSDVECVASLFKSGLLEAVVLVFLLRPSAMSLVELDIVDPLITVLKTREEDLLKMCMKPKTASVLLLAQLLKSGEEVQTFEISRTLISENAIESIMGSLEADMREERISAIVMLLRCMQEDGRYRNIIADKADLFPILESLVGANDGEFFLIVQFLSELVKLDRRTFNEQILHIIKDEGIFSTMQMLLIYLQTAPQENCPVVAGLLLQLELLVEPRKMSIYREEALDALISCLENTNCLSTQIAAVETILSLQGRFSQAGEPLARAFLVRCAGLNRNTSGIKRDQLASMSDEILEEEKNAEEWEKNMAFVLVKHEFGLIFEALAEGLRSRYAELCSACFVAAIWLVHMLIILPDTGDLWNHRELLSADCSINGEVLSIVCFKDKIFSGHSDGTIKMWSINSKGMHCEQVHEMKDHVNNLVVSNSISCFIPQGAGIKVHSWSGASKLLNPQKYVKCLTLVQGNLYCGCQDNSIQEIDLATGTLSTIQSGSRKLMSKAAPVYTIQASDGLLYSASSPLDGAAVKMWSTSNYSVVVLLPSMSEVRSMAVSSDLIYPGCKGGLIEVWCKKKHCKIETLQAGTDAKVISMALTSNEDVLVIGTSDGKIQAWKLN